MERLNPNDDIASSSPGVQIASNTDQVPDASTQGILSDVNRIEQEFDRVIEFESQDRLRCKRNWQMYAGLDLGQYTEDDKAQAQLEGRDLATFNITTQKVDSLTGNILKNQFDSDFVPVEGAESILTNVLKSMYLSDKEMMDWEPAYNQLVLAGNIYRGDEEMYIDRRYHPLGNIGFRTHLPGYVAYDPRWKTLSAKDCQMAWVVSYLTGSQIMDMWPEKAKTLNFVERDVERTKTQGEFFDALIDSSVTPLFEMSETQAAFNYYRIIRKFEMVTEDVIIEYDEMTGIDLPVGTDYAAKLAFLNKNNPSWEPGRVKKRTEKRRVCMVTTVCRQLDINEPLEKKPCEVQIGRLPLFPWSASRINGKCRGIVDLLADIQYKINYREELITNLIETEACGSQLIDPLLFGEDEDKIAEYKLKRNQPRQTFETAPGALQRGLAPQPVSKAIFPQDVRDQLQRMWDYADRISKAPAVFDARSEKSGESGYLFAQKARVAEQQSYTLFADLKRHENEKAEAYMEQAKIQYTIGGIERRFLVANVRKGVGGSSETDWQTVVVNRRWFEDDDSGEPVEKVENDFANLPRHKVVISESPSSSTNRLITRAVATELLRVIPPEYIGTRQVFTAALVDSLDTFTSKQHADLDEMRELEQTMAKETLKANTLKLRLANKQMQAQLDQAPAQAAPPLPGAFPGPGAEPGVPAVAPAPGAGAAGPIDAFAAAETEPVPPEKSMGFKQGGVIDIVQDAKIKTFKPDIAVTGVET